MPSTANREGFRKHHLAIGKRQLQFRFDFPALVAINGVSQLRALS